MTMGPEPMIKALWMSARLGISGAPVVLHHGEESLKEPLRIVRTRGGLGVVLNRIDGELLVAHPLQGPVVGVDVGQLHLRRIHGFDVYTEAVVLGGDGDRAPRQVLDRVITPA